MDHQHIGADIKTIDRADFDTVHVFAPDAGFGDDIGHLALSFALRIRRCGRRSIALLHVDPKRPLVPLYFVEQYASRPQWNTNSRDGTQ